MLRGSLLRPLCRLHAPNTSWNLVARRHIGLEDEEVIEIKKKRVLKEYRRLQQQLAGSTENIRLREEALKNVKKIADYYKVLGIEQSATEKEVRAAFYTLSKQLHPDAVAARNEENIPEEERAEKFARVQDAYATLGSHWKRWEYNQLRMQGAPSVADHERQHGHRRMGYCILLVFASMFLFIGTSTSLS